MRDARFNSDTVEPRHWLDHGKFSRSMVVLFRWKEIQAGKILVGLGNVLELPARLAGTKKG